MNSLSTYAKMNGGTFTVLKPPDRIVGTNWINTNPSVVFYNGRYYVNQRIVNYNKLYSNKKFELYSNGVNQSIYLSGDDSCYISENIVTDAHSGAQHEIEFPRHFEAKYVGLEDAKFVIWGDRLYMYGTRCDVYYSQANICIYLIDTNSFTVEKEWVVKNRWLDGMEPLSTPGWQVQKNWMAIPDKPFCFIYTPSPTVVVEVNPDDCTYSLVTPQYIGNIDSVIRGTAPLCRVDSDTYAALVHTNDGGFDENGNYMCKYKFKALLYDNLFNVIKESEWFVFMNDMTEFCCGMCVNDGKITFTHSSFDGSSYLTELGLDKFLTFIDEKEHNQNLFNEKFIYATAAAMEMDGLNAISWFNYIACSTKQAETIHYDSAVRVLAFWGLNENFVREYLANLIFLAYKYTKLFPDRCEAFYLQSIFEARNGNLERAAELKSKADSVRDGRDCIIDRYVPTLYI